MCLQCRGSRQEPQNVVQLLQCYLRAAELEIRTAEGSLRSDLDVKGLKAQDLGRIEGLEAREREREDRAGPRDGESRLRDSGRRL